MPLNARRMDLSKSPRILLAEDDPASLAFLVEVLRSLGCSVTAAVDGESARRLASEQLFDVLMLDHHLPVLDGDAVLQAVRRDGEAASHTTIALAATAEPDPAIHACLRAAGFARVLVKPFTAAHLQEALREMGIISVQSVTSTPPALDDSAGIRASGGNEALLALRKLFIQELDALSRELDAMGGNAAAISGRLHRLRASCGFCGATALQDAAAKLSNALHAAEPALIAERRAEFQKALVLTREALHHHHG